MWGDDALPVASDRALALAAPLRETGAAGDRAAAGLAFDTGPTQLLFRAARGLARDFDNFGFELTGDAATFARAAADAELSPEEANERYGIEGALAFDRPVAASRAAELWDIKQTELLRQDTIARSSLHKGAAGFARTLAFSLAGGVADPLMLGVGMMPVGGIASLRAGVLAPLAAAETSASLGARLGARGAFGALEGAAGALILEPVVLPLARWRENRDYGLWDSAVNVTGGALLGGLGGAFARRYSPDDAARAMASAVGAVADGQPVDVAAVLAEAASLRAAGGDPDAIEASVRNFFDDLAGDGERVALDDALPGGIDRFLRAGADDAGRPRDPDAVGIARLQVSLGLKAQRAGDPVEALARFQAAGMIAFEGPMRVRAEKLYERLDRRLDALDDTAVQARASAIVDTIHDHYHDRVRALDAGDDAGLSGAGGGLEVQVAPQAPAGGDQQARAERLDDPVRGRIRLMDDGDGLAAPVDAGAAARPGARPAVGGGLRNDPGGGDGGGAATGGGGAADGGGAGFARAGPADLDPAGNGPAPGERGPGRGGVAEGGAGGGGNDGGGRGAAQAPAELNARALLESPAARAGFARTVETWRSADGRDRSYRFRIDDVGPEISVAIARGPIGDIVQWGFGGADAAAGRTGAQRFRNVVEIMARVSAVVERDAAENAPGAYVFSGASVHHDGLYGAYFRRHQLAGYAFERAESGAFRLRRLADGEAAPVEALTAADAALLEAAYGPALAAQLKDPELRAGFAASAEAMADLARAIDAGAAPAALDLRPALADAVAVMDASPARRAALADALDARGRDALALIAAENLAAPRPRASIAENLETYARIARAVEDAPDAGRQPESGPDAGPDDRSRVRGGDGGSDGGGGPRRDAGGGAADRGPAPGGGRRDLDARLLAADPELKAIADALETAQADVRLAADQGLLAADEAQAALAVLEPPEKSRARYELGRAAAFCLRNAA